MGNGYNTWRGVVYDGCRLEMLEVISLIKNVFIYSRKRSIFSPTSIKLGFVVSAKLNVCLGAVSSAVLATIEFSCNRLVH